jgi:ring-1,2-phenylacetyl-CoA epoxidase subunit PaaE
MSAGFHTLTIAEISRETADAVSLRFRVPDDLQGAFAFKAGQHLTLRADIGGEDIRRNYSLCVAPQEGFLKVAIKQVAQGVFSNWAANTLCVGDSVEVMPPHGSFTAEFNAGNKRHYAAFAGGSGITPILGLLKTALATEPHSRFTLFYGNRDSSSVIFLEELAQLKDRYLARLELFNFLSDEFEDIDLFNGMLNREKCDEIIETLIDVKNIDMFFICGPGPMMDAAESALITADVPKDRILIERFTAGKPSAQGAALLAAQTQKAAGVPMRITLDGRTRILAFDAELGNILDTARASGMSAPYACKAGVCATCRAKVISGKVTMAVHYGLSDQEITDGYVLTCQAFPEGENVVLDYDA